MDEPNRKWVSDITYIKVKRTWLYRAAVVDLFSRMVVGWALDTQLRESLILDAFTMAAGQRDINENTLIH